MKKKANQTKVKAVKVVAPIVETVYEINRPNWNDLCELFAEDNE